MNDRRRFTDEDLRLLAGLMRHEFEDQRSLRKNGHSMKQWLAKVFTLERIGLLVIGIVMAVYSFGGDIRDAKRDLARSVREASLATARADAAAASAQVTADSIAQTRLELSEVVASLKAQQGATADVTQRVALSVTRAEFRSAMAQQILPRLERIEKRLEAIR